jgi:hypothetical protein
MRLKRALGILGLAVLIPLIMVCSKGGMGADGDDGNSPYNILDLRVSAISDSTITLVWTATGDDSSAGTAFQYDIRKFNRMITNSSWDSTAELTGEPAPSPAGEIDSMVVGGLMRDSTYYFAMRACDEAGNWSGHSNCAQGSCIIDVIIAFPDSNLEAAIRRQIHKPNGDIYKSDVMLMTFLEGNQAGISDLTGIGQCSNLTTIYMSGNHISDLGPLSELHRLASIQFVGNNISVLAPLSGLTTLEALVLRANPLGDISPIANLTNIHWLDLTQDGLSDISPLLTNSGLAAGDTLWLGYNPLSHQSLNTYIPQLESRGVWVYHD